MTLGRRRRRASSALTASLAAAMLLSASAFADVTKEQCIDANGQARELRREGKLAAAREQLRLCGNPKCPAMVRDDCAKRLDEVDKAQPTMAFPRRERRTRLPARRRPRRAAEWARGISKCSRS